MVKAGRMVNWNRLDSGAKRERKQQETTNRHQRESTGINLNRLASGNESVAFNGNQLQAEAIGRNQHLEQPRNARLVSARPLDAVGASGCLVEWKISAIN